MSFNIPQTVEMLLELRLDVHWTCAACLMMVASNLRNSSQVNFGGSTEKDTLAFLAFDARLALK